MFSVNILYFLIFRNMIQAIKLFSMLCYNFQSIENAKHGMGKNRLMAFKKAITPLFFGHLNEVIKTSR